VALVADLELLQQLPSHKAHLVDFHRQRKAVQVHLDNQDSKQVHLAVLDKIIHRRPVHSELRLNLAHSEHRAQAHLAAAHLEVPLQVRLVATKRALLVVVATLHLLNTEAKYINAIINHYIKMMPHIQTSS
jgi:hypothetical protein